MNNVPFEAPPRVWEPKLKTWWVKATRTLRSRSCRKNGIVDIEVRGAEHLRQAIQAGMGILITPNHPFHYDTYSVVNASDHVNRPFYYMACWQVFSRTGKWGQWALQSCGCFSVNREGVDQRALRTAVDILQNRDHPLVIFPEGEVYHTNDRVTPFREGAAMISLMAARKADRPVVVIPAAIKYWYVDNPLDQLLGMLDEFERRIYWRPAPKLPPINRLYRLAGALLAVKEVEYLGHPQSGTVDQRLAGLQQHILGMHEKALDISSTATSVPERIKEVRRRAIEALEKPDSANLPPASVVHALEDMFLVTQLYSYPGNYVAESPTLERFAETIDKLEEDMLGGAYPKVRGSKRVVVEFGAPLEVPREKGPRNQASLLSNSMESQVQSMIQRLNDEAKRETLVF